MELKTVVMCVYFSVAAINSLHAALGTPVLPGWTSAGGDPCGEAWQGVICNDSAIVSMYVNLIGWLLLLWMVLNMFVGSGLMSHDYMIL